MKVVVAADAGTSLAPALANEGIEAVGVFAAADPALAVVDGMLGSDGSAFALALAGADALLLEASRHTLTAGVVSMCDRAGVRIVPLQGSPDADRVAEAFGLSGPTPADAPAWELAARLADDRAPREVTGDARSPAAPIGSGAPRVIAVWGAAGSPGRSTIAVELAVELARGGSPVALVDADTHAPSLALSLGLADEGPGFAAACRQAGIGGLDARELTRISIPLGRTGVDVLTGINRPSRWPELSDARVAAALEVCRSWVSHTVVDVSSSLERDEEIVSDLEGPRRNAATIAALRSADLVVAVVGADPVGVARFLRGYGELRATVGSTPVVVVANRLRPGTLGIDARGQVRRTLDRFGGVADVWFVPHDPRSADAALLTAQPISVSAPRSVFAVALRRFVAEAIVPAVGSQRPRRRRRAA